MSKIIFWVVVILIGLLVLRLYNLRQVRKKNSQREPRGARLSESMVRCSRCGVYLPKSEAKPAAEGYVCGAGCEPRRPG